MIGFTPAACAALVELHHREQVALVGQRDRRHARRGRRRPSGPAHRPRLRSGCARRCRPASTRCAGGDGRTWTAMTRQLVRCRSGGRGEAHRLEAAAVDRRRTESIQRLAVLAACRSPCARRSRTADRARRGRPSSRRASTLARIDAAPMQMRSASPSMIASKLQSSGSPTNDGQRLPSICTCAGRTRRPSSARRIAR